MLLHSGFALAAVTVAAAAALLLMHGCDTVSAEAPRYDKRLLAKMLNRTVDFCDSPSSEGCAQRWIDEVGRFGDHFANIVNRFSFSYSNRLDNEVGTEMLDLANKVQIWSLRHLKIARRFQWSRFSSKSLRRRFLILTQDMTMENDSERIELSQLQKSLMELYTKAAACPIQNGRALPCLEAGEQAVTDAIGSSNATYDFKAAVWRAWHDATATALAGNFTRYVALTNKAAHLAGFRDAGDADWRLDFESDTFNSDVLTWHHQLLDLYQQLHAYVRHKISRRFPNKFDPAGCLPAHILGRDQWAQQWNLPDSDFPYPDAAKASNNYSRLLEDEYGSFRKLVKAAERFFTSLGMPGMTQVFWRKSDFLKPDNASIVKDCHASAWDFSSRTDFRIKMCGRIDRENFYVIHHEMGHIEYFMAYSHLPREFRAGANSGFHEAIGDTVALSVDTRAHYAKLGLVNSSQLSLEEEINGLFSTALNKVSFLPFALSTGIFRWLVFNGTASPANYNRVWWGLRSQLGGVCPPTDRPESGFDAGAKYHVALDISYIRYYFSHILQFQLHRRMCDLSGHEGQISRCDFYQSRKAGKKFWKMLKAGSRQPWQEILQEFTGDDGLQTSAMLEYFKPLHDWLRDYNQRNGVPVGWKVPDNVLKGVSR